MSDPGTASPGEASTGDGLSQPVPDVAPVGVPVSDDGPVHSEVPLPYPTNGEVPPAGTMQGPSEVGALRECDDGTGVIVHTQAELDALAGCTSLYGLLVSGPLDLRPLAALRRVGLGGVQLGSGVTSLAGLEGLEVATRFSAYGTALPNLLGLSSLRYVEAFEFARNDVPITDLRGLENVTGIRILRIYGNSALASLRGLNLSGNFEYVVIEDNPSLVDVAALNDIESVEREFTFGDSVAPALRLDALQRVGRTLLIHDNTGLAQLSLANVLSIDRLELKGNQPLASASFDRLAELAEFVLENNPVIQRIPAFPALARVGNVRITDNYELESVNGFPALASAGDIDISYNENLLSIDLSSLQEGQGLYVYRNTALDGTNVAAALSGASIERKRVAPTQETLPLEPCPWVQDDYCDGDPVDTWRFQFQQSALCRREADPACAAR